MRRDLAGLVLVVGVLFAGLAATGVVLGPATSTETRYAEMGREMFVSGDWVIPQLNGAPLLEKPPFVYWVHAAAFAVFGVSDLTARIPNLVAGLLVLLVVAFGARRFAPAADDAETRRTRGLLAAFALATMPAFLIQAYTISIDIWLVLVTTVAGLCLLESDRTAGKPGLRWVLLLHGMLGLGMLVKGPLSLALVGIAGLVVAIARRDPRPLRPFWHPAGIALFLAISVPWYIAADARIPGLLRDLVSRRLFGGLASSTDFHSHSLRIVWIPFVGTFPWLATLPRGVIPLFRGGGWRRGPALALLLLTLAAPVLFTFSESRLVSYSSPAFPFLALLVALGWPLGAHDPEVAAGHRRRLARASIGAGLVATGLATWLLVRLDPSTGCIVLAIGGTLLALVSIVWPRPGAFFARPIPRVAGIVGGLVATIAALVMTAPLKIPAAKPIWDAVERVRRPGDALGVVLDYSADWGLFPWNSRGLVTYFDYPTKTMMVTAADFAPDRFRHKDELKAWFTAPERRFLFMRKRDVSRADYLGDARTFLVTEGGKYVVLTNLPLAPAGN